MEENESLDNTNAVASIIETGDTEEVRMILGDRTKIRHAGVIRPGIKTPTGDCTEQMKAIYKRMLNEDYGFSAIDAEMLKAAPKTWTKKTCLRPSNCDYFIVRAEDFKNPRDAEYIMKTYADADGKLRTLPVWFPTGDIATVLPHNFRAFDGGGNVRCVSFYEGDRLKFKYIPKDTKLPAKKEDWKILDSDDEDEATKACGYKVQFGGMLRFYVPGLRTAGEVILPSRSWYGLSEAIAVLRRVRSILGRFDNLFKGQPFFELVKTEEEVKHEGQKSKQWIASIQLAVDPMELARYVEPEQVAMRGHRAMSMLTGKASPPPEQPEPEQTEPVEPEPKPSPEMEAAIAAIKGLGDKAKIPFDGLKTYFMICHAGVALEDALLEELRTFYKGLNSRFAKDFAGTKADIEKAVSENTELPFGGES